MADERIETLQERVLEAKKQVRQYMSVKELSKESIKDIISEVSETQDDLDTLLGRTDSDISATTKHLKSELKKLLTDAESSDKAAIKALEEKARAIADMAGDVDDEESVYLAESASATLNALAGIKKAYKDDKPDDMLGSGLFTTVFGSKLGGWMASTGDTGKKGKKRIAAELQQETLEAEIAALQGGGDDAEDADGLTKSEQAENRREESIKYRDETLRSKLIITMLKEIQKNTRMLLGGTGFAVIPAGGGGGDGDGPDGGDPSMLETVGGGLLDVGIFAGGTMALSGIANWAKGLLGIGAAAQTAATMGEVSGGGLAALWGTEAAAPASWLTRTFTGLLSKVAIPVTVAAEIFQQQIRQLSQENVRVGSQSTWTSTKDVTGALIDDYTQMQILPPRDVYKSLGMDQSDITKRKLLINEQHMLMRMQAATEEYTTGGFWTGDKRGNEHLLALEGDIYARQDLIFKLQPQTLEEALGYFAVSPETYDKMQKMGSKLKGATNILETRDNYRINSAVGLTEMMNPAFRHPKFGAAAFLQWKEKEVSTLGGTSFWDTNVRLGEGLTRMGFGGDWDISQQRVTDFTPNMLVPETLTERMQQGRENQRRWDELERLRKEDRRINPPRNRHNDWSGRPQANIGINNTTHVASASTSRDFDLMRDGRAMDDDWNYDLRVG